MSTQSQGPKLAADEPDAGVLGALVQAERAAMNRMNRTNRTNRTNPSTAAQRQTWKRVVASVAVGGTPPVPPASISGPAATATSLWLKIVLGIIVGGVVVAAGYQLTVDPGPEPIAGSVTPSRKSPPSASPVPTSTVSRTQPAVPSQPAAMATPHPPPEVSPPEAAPARPSPAAPPDASPSSDLTEETRLLAKARARLRAGSPSDALAPLTEHARRFPQGQLSEDRMVLRAQALCESGDTKAGLTAASALREAFPTSSHLPRVSRACES